MEPLGLLQAGSGGGEAAGRLSAFLLDHFAARKPQAPVRARRRCILRAAGGCTDSDRLARR
jgi:hypothetical protein